MTPTAAAPEIVSFPIDKIVEDHYTQVRGGLNPETVAAYEQIIAEHGSMDPVVLFRLDPAENNSPVIVSDGFHRIAAYRNCGKTKIPAQVREGTSSGALFYSLRTNCRHGAVMTSAQKRVAAGMAVNDPKVGEMTDKQIASLIGVSASLVNEVRRGITPTVKRERTQKAKRAEATSSRPDTSNKRKAKEEKLTKAMVLREINGHLSDETITEADILKSFASANEEYVWCKKTGKALVLTLVAGNGRQILSVPVTVKTIDAEVIKLSYAGAEKISIAGS